MTLSLLLVLTLLAGCATKERIEVAPVALPQWYTSPPHADRHYLYAVGEGSQRNEAIADALGQIRAMLGVSVATHFESAITERQGVQSDYQKQTDSQIVTTAAALPIAHYELIESLQHSYRSALVLVRCERRQLIEGFKEEIETQRKSLELRLSKRTLDDLMALEAEAEAFETQFPNLLSALTTLGGDAQSYAADYPSMRAQIEAYRASFSFALHTKEGDAALLSIIRSALSQKGYRIAKEGDAEYKIALDAHTDTVMAYGFYVVRARLELQTLDAKGHIIRSAIVALVAQNAQSIAMATQELGRKLAQHIDAEGVESLLGWR